MVRLRGIEPLLPGWKPGVLTTKRKPHMVDPAGLEPATARLWAESSNQLSYGSLIMACLKRFELLAHGLEGRCSIQLSYRHIYFLFFWLMVSHTGIEPVTPWLKVMCSTDWANGSYLTLERETRVELATFSLEGWHSTNWVTPANFWNGRCSRIWTCDPLLPRQVRYRAALCTAISMFSLDR